MSSTVSDAAAFKIPAKVGLTDIDGLHRELMEALGSASGLALYLDALEEADLSFVQLVVAAGASARRDGKELFVSPPNAVLRNLLERGGFLREEASRRFWISEETV